MLSTYDTIFPFFFKQYFIISKKNNYKNYINFSGDIYIYYGQRNQYNIFNYKIKNYLDAEMLVNIKFS